MEQFSSSSEFQFVKNLTPRMYTVDPSYKTEKARLMRDVRLMRESLEGKIPSQTTNDPEQLALLIAKLKKYKGTTSKEDDNHAEERLDITRDNRIVTSPVKGQTSGESSGEDNAAASIQRKNIKNIHTTD